MSLTLHENLVGFNRTSSVESDFSIRREYEGTLALDKSRVPHLAMPVSIQYTEPRVLPNEYTAPYSAYQSMLQSTTKKSVRSIERLLGLGAQIDDTFLAHTARYGTFEVFLFCVNNHPMLTSTSYQLCIAGAVYSRNLEVLEHILNVAPEESKTVPFDTLLLLLQDQPTKYENTFKIIDVLVKNVKFFVYAVPGIDSSEAMTGAFISQLDVFFTRAKNRNMFLTGGDRDWIIEFLTGHIVPDRLAARLI